GAVCTLRRPWAPRAAPPSPVLRSRAYASEADQAAQRRRRRLRSWPDGRRRGAPGAPQARRSAVGGGAAPRRGGQAPARRAGLAAPPRGRPPALRRRRPARRPRAPRGGPCAGREPRLPRRVELHLRAPPPRHGRPELKLSALVNSCVALGDKAL